MNKKFSKFAIISTLVVSILSCKNFMNGGDFLTQLEDNVWNMNHEQPVAKIISPIYSPTGDHRDVSIIFSFTKTMNPETFPAAFFITDSSGNSIRENYGDPIWNDDFTQVIVPVNKSKMLEIPEGGAISIKITLSLALKDSDGVSIKQPIVEIFTLNSNYDNEGPIFAAYKAAINNTNLNIDERNFIEGFIEEGEVPVTEKTTNIINTNHIKDKISFYLEGYDYDSAKVWAYVDYSRAYTRDGTAVNEPTETTFFELTNHSEESNTSSRTFTLDLSNTKYIDGLYKINLYLKDVSGNSSNEVKTFYVVRDTKNELSQDEAINTRTPAWRYEAVRQDTPITLKQINENNKTVQIYNYRDDVFMKYRGTEYYTDFTDFKYFFNYGKLVADTNGKLSVDTNDLHSISTPIPPYKAAKTPGEYVISSCDFDYPQEILNYIQANIYNYFFLEIVSEDAVGNQAKLKICFPPKNNFYSYTVNPVPDTNIYKATLNFNNRQNANLNNELDMQQYEIMSYTRIFYAEKSSVKPDEELVLTNDSYAVGHDNDDFSDNPFIFIESDKEYLVVLQTCLIHNHGGHWCGTTYNEPYVITNLSTANAGTENDYTFSDSYSLTASKTSMGPNTGLTKLTITPPPTQEDGISFYYGWCTNPNDPSGEIWNYFEPIINGNNHEIIVNTLITPQVDTWAEGQDWSSINNDYSNVRTHNTIQNLYPAAEFNTIGKLQIFAKKQGSPTIVEGPTCDISFNSENDDNIPPALDTYRPKHNLTLSADGSSYYTDDDFIHDNEWNDSDEFIYYYTTYQPSWGIDLNVLSESQIKTLPSANNIMLHYADYNDWEFSLPVINHSSHIQLPVNGLPDGDYMFYFTFADKNGNSTTDTIGKAHIETFKNKLDVSFTKKGTESNQNDKLKANLKLEPGENRTYNNIFVQYFDSDDWQKFFLSFDYNNDTITNSSSYISNNKYTREVNFNAINRMKKVNNQLQFETYSNDNLPLSNSSLVQQNSTYKNKNNFPDDGNLPKAHFYRLNVTSYNIDPTWATTVVVNGNTYLRYETDPKYGSSQTHFAYNEYPEFFTSDIFVDETVSYPTYIYIPSDSDQLTNITHSLDGYTGRLRSSHKVLVNVISSLTDLGDNIDEWERRGKLIYSKEISPTTNDEVVFDYSTAQDKVYQSEKGKRYYVVTYHFVDNEAAISRVFRTF